MSARDFFDAAFAEHESVVRESGGPSRGPLERLVETCVGSIGRLFARQIEALDRAGDVTTEIPAPGCSPNLVLGLRRTPQMGLLRCGALEIKVGLV